MQAEEQVDWRNIRLRPGDWSCPVHGIIDPARGGLVPYCDRPVGGQRCMRVAWLTVPAGGRLASVEPRPKTCPSGHLLGPRTVLLGTQPCPCTPAGFHRTWACRSCPSGVEPQRWPPHDETVPMPR